MIAAVKTGDLSPIGQLSNLRSLALYSMPIEDIEPLMSLTKLEELKFSDKNQISPKTIKELQQAMPSCQISFRN